MTAEQYDKATKIMRLLDFANGHANDLLKQKESLLAKDQDSFEMRERGSGLYITMTSSSVIDCINRELSQLHATLGELQAQFKAI